jgi:hypothetical protein
LEKIRDYVTADQPVGYRNYLCFYYFIHAKRVFSTVEQAYEAVREFNQKMPYPLSESKLYNAVSSAKKKEYFVKNVTLAAIFHLPDSVAENLGLTGTKSKAEQIQECKEGIVKFRREGKNNCEIYSSLGLTKKTCERYITELIRDGKIMSRKLKTKLQNVIAERKNGENNAVMGGGEVEKDTAAEEQEETLDYALENIFPVKWINPEVWEVWA